MKLKGSLLLLILLPMLCNAQQNDSISKVFTLQDIVISATRTTAKIDEIPCRINLIKKQEIQNFPILNIDNILQSIANVYVNRSSGIFSKNASVTMRGLDGTNRVLVMYDGVPLNKAAGGGINWHIFDGQDIENIEVTKGPNSAVYGNNAMGGSINIISSLPVKQFETEITTGFSTYNTFDGKISIASNSIKNNKGGFFAINGYYRQGDGYYFVKPEVKDSNDTKLFLKEGGGTFKGGYRFNNKIQFTLFYNLYHDIRGDGIKIFEPKGGYYKDLTQVAIGNLEILNSGFTINVKPYLHLENYTQHTERINTIGDVYKLYDSNQKSYDIGILANASKILGKIHKLNFGFDAKTSNIQAADIYRTSPDEIMRYGEMNFVASFVQDEITLKKNLFLLAGARIEYSQFLNGHQEVKNPTTTTGFSSSFEKYFDNKNWFNISPKIALRYQLTKYFGSYVSISQGFMPATLDDMVSSRKISKGFKIANPHLKPETLMNYEVGFEVKPNSNIRFENSIYFSNGSNFQYFIQTGDTIEMDKIVFQRQNLAKVQVAGTENSLFIVIQKNQSFRINYTYNLSTISKFDGIGEMGESLKGKHLAETPPHQAFIGYYNQNKYANFSLILNYIGKQWADESNTATIEPYATIDLMASHTFFKKLTASIQIQNLFDYLYVDKKDGICQGRFINFNLSYTFINE